MKKFLFTLILTFPVLSFGQVDFDNPPWEIGCDSADTQTDMNICSYASYKIADSLMTEAYTKLVAHFDTLWLETKKNGSDDKRYRKETLRSIWKQKDFFISSHEDFLTMRENVIACMGLQYEGGSMRPLVVNSYARHVTINQLKLYTIMTTEVMGW